MENVRLRVLFEKSICRAKNFGELKRCWVLLKPQYKTISDFSSHILNVFDLHNACPNGLLLSMDGFTLPPFESTGILKNEDIIRVEMEKDGEIFKVDGGVNSMQLAEIVKIPPACNGIDLLANKEFDNESGGYETESEDVKPVSKKRKKSKQVQSSSSKKEKSDYVKAKKRKVNLEDIENNGHAIEDGTPSGAKIEGRIKDKRVKVSSKKQRSNAPQENANVNDSSFGTPSDEKKLPSRSARRKKAKRQWLRELRKAENKEKQLFEKFNQQSVNENQTKSEGSSENKNHKTSEEATSEKDENKTKGDHEQTDPDSDKDNDIVPVVIRPGHIRFTPLSKADDIQTAQQSQIPMETFQWNGITSKKKGQKWGKEKIATPKKNDSSGLIQDCSTVTVETPVIDHTDFDKLPPYTTLPKEGDVIAYRLIELSSSWTPELSPYRVGKISRYDMNTNMLLLLQVSEYPIPVEKIDGETSIVASETSYREDGSLQIKFSVLIDVRLVKHSNQSAETSDASGVKEVTVQNQDARANYWSEKTNEVPAPAPAPAPAQPNGPASVWDEINQAIHAKKVELNGEDNWNRSESSGTKPWSYRALRGSAMGPTMAWLRSQNEL